LNAPIINLRSALPLHRRLSGDLGTLALWLLWGAVIRHALGGLLLGSGTGGLLLLGVVLTARVPRWRPSAPAPRVPRTLVGHVPVTSTRLAMGSQFGLSEVELFRAQHAQVCTVFHDQDGSIRRLVCHLPGDEWTPPALPVSSLRSP
jgi:hypothetical protein